ncbi:MAG: class III signal peptide-containing protein [archaeon]
MKLKKLLKETKAQTSMEVLLLLAGAVLIATMVGLYLKGLPTQANISSNVEGISQNIIKDIER